MQISGEKIVLREFRDTDLEAMHSWVNDEEVTRYLSMSVFPRTFEDSRKFLENQLSRRSEEYVNFVIALKDDENKKYIGTVGLRNIDYINRNCELAITIGVRDKQNSGCGTEAVKLIVQYAFNSLNMHKVYLSVLNVNDKAKRVYEKCGFVKSAEFKDHIFKNGNYYDLLYMEKLNNQER